MFSLESKPGRLCDSPGRREFLTVGGLGLFGLSLHDFLRRTARATEAEQASHPSTAGPGTFGRAQGVILLYLQGAPSHIDLWDPKPLAPAEFRGEFRPIETSAPGMLLGEVLPKLARQADKFTVVRSIGVKPKGLPNHGSAIYMLMTGHDSSNFSPTGLAVPPSREDLPSVGSVVSRYRPSEPGALSYVALCGPVREAAVAGLAQSAGLMGGAHDPYSMYEDPTQPLKLEQFTLPADVTLGRLRGRLDLRNAIEARESLRENTFDRFFERALTILESDKALASFQLDRESPRLREAYGATRFGQSCLLARRLIEAGTRFVQVTWPSGSDTEPIAGPDGSWDTHRNNFPMLRDHRCPVFDQATSALLLDLHERGLLESTLVVAIGEFGRSPRIGAQTTNNVGPGGRDHWPNCYSFMLAGAGVRPGCVHGESDRIGAFPKSSPVHPYDVIATVHHLLGIPPQTEYVDTLHRPRRLTQSGQPILGLF